MKKLILLTSLCLPCLSYAEMPVIDLGAIAKMEEQISAMQRQYKVMQNTYKNGQKQLDATQKLKQFNSGHYRLGNMKNSSSDLKMRQWSPKTWDDALKNIAGGNPKRYEQLVKDYQKHNRTLSDEVFLKGATRRQLERYQQNKAVNQASSVQTTYAFDDVNEHLNTVYELSQQIEKTENTKAALDLNSRLMAEMAYIQIQSLKLQTLISQQQAQTGANDLADTSDIASFNRLPDM